MAQINTSQMIGALTSQTIQFLVERRWPMVPSTDPQEKPCVAWKSFQKQLVNSAETPSSEVALRIA